MYDAHADRGTRNIAFRKQGRFREAIDLYRKALSLDPEDDHLHYNLARVLMEDGREGEARVHVLKALELYPDFMEAKDLLDRLEQGHAGESPEGVIDAPADRAGG